MQRRLEEKEELIQRKKEIEEVRQMSPLVWAYIGDSIYELYVRMHLVQSTKLKPHYLHIKAIQYVKAGAQAEILKNIEVNLLEGNLYCQPIPVEEMLEMENKDMMG